VLDFRQLLIGFSILAMYIHSLIMYIWLYILFHYLLRLLCRFGVLFVIRVLSQNQLPVVSSPSVDNTRGWGKDRTLQISPLQP